MVDIRQYDENGRNKIIDYLKDCEYIADLGCNKQKIRPDAIGYDNDPGVNPDICCDLQDDILYEKYFDGICCSHFLEHVVKLRDFLKMCRMMLNDGGKFAVVVPDGETVDSSTLGDSSNTHEQLFTPITLRLYLENAGFKDVETSYYDRPSAYKQTKGIFGCGIK